LISGLVAIVAAIAYLSMGDARAPFAVAIKTVPVFVLAWNALSEAPFPARRLAGIGLVVSAIADAVIVFRFLPGLVGFLIAHLCYIAAFTMCEPKPRFFRLAMPLLWGIVALPYLVSRSGSMGAPIAIYGLVILVMMWRAAAAVTTFGWNASTMGFARTRWSRGRASSARSPARMF
jgi:alkenylglycerophosphocholine hydrolase